MYHTEDIICRNIVTPDGEQEFQVRFFRDEGAGIATTPTGKSYFLLDSAEYWYDLIQEAYPPIMRCACKNDLFHLIFNYTPRVGTEDFNAITIACKCTACMKVKKLPAIEIDYAPSSHLLDSPLTYCKQPKIKYKTYSLKGYWTKEELLGIARFFLDKGLFIYCWYWDQQTGKRCVKEVSAEELCSFLTFKVTYLAVYFSEEPLPDVFETAPSDKNGIIIPHDLWRKRGIFMLHAPISVISHGMFHEMNFCSEYLDKAGNIVPKSASFCTLAQEFRKYSRKLLKK